MTLLNILIKTVFIYYEFHLKLIKLRLLGPLTSLALKYTRSFNYFNQIYWQI